MKKILVGLFLILGVLTFSKGKEVIVPKIVITIINDDYSNPIARKVERSGIIKKAFSLGDMITFRHKSDDKKFSENLIEEIWKKDKKLPDKMTFIIEPNEEKTMIQLLKSLKEYKYKGQVEVIELSMEKNLEIEKLIEKYGWEYNHYSDINDLKGEVEISGIKYEKNKYIARILFDKYEFMKKK